MCFVVDLSEVVRCNLTQSLRTASLKLGVRGNLPRL